MRTEIIDAARQQEHNKGREAKAQATTGQNSGFGNSTGNVEIIEKLFELFLFSAQCWDS